MKTSLRHIFSAAIAVLPLALCAQAPQNVKMVDLGLSVKWADRNIGADAPEQAGTYFAWCEKNAKAEYEWDTYELNIPTDPMYCVNIGDEISGSEHDIATSIWGNGWRMPTQEEVEELVDNSTYKWTVRGGVAGALFTSKKNGKSIFIPASGQAKRKGAVGFGVHGACWTGTAPGGNRFYASVLYIYEKDGFSCFKDKCYGLPVRPVMSISTTSKQKTTADDVYQP